MCFEILYKGKVNMIGVVGLCRMYILVTPVQ